MQQAKVMRAREIIQLALDFANEACDGFYPKNANRAAHAQMDAIQKEQFGYDVNALLENQQRPFLVRLLKWYSDWRCPPMDSRKPGRLTELEDYLVCATPLANDFPPFNGAETDNSYDQFCDALVATIVKNTDWVNQPFQTVNVAKASNEENHVISEEMKKIFALFRHPDTGDFLAIKRTSDVGYDYADDIETTFDNVFLGLCYIPNSVASGLNRFLKSAE